MLQLQISALLRQFLVTFKIIVCRKCLAARITPNTSQVFRYVSRERTLVRQNLVTHSASSGVAQVNLEVRVAVSSRAVRLLAHAANEPHITFNYLFPRSPSRDWWDQWVACKQ